MSIHSSRDLGFVAFTAGTSYTRYGGHNSYYRTPLIIEDIADIVSGDFSQYGSPTFLGGGGTPKMTLRFKNLSKGDILRFVMPSSQPHAPSDPVAMLVLTSGGKRTEVIMGYPDTVGGDGVIYSALGECIVDFENGVDVVMEFSPTTTYCKDWTKVSAPDPLPGYSVPGLMYIDVKRYTIPTPVATPPGGNYHVPVSPVFSCPDAEALIRYTTDGSEPGKNSKSYMCASQITETTTFKVKAFKADYDPSDTLTVTYTMVASDNEGGNEQVSEYIQNAINNSQIRIYSPWVTVYDETIGAKVDISGESEVIAALVSTYKNYEPWYSYAGPNRGKVSRALSLATEYSQKERDLLNAGTNAVNPIAKLGESGFLIYGNKTSLRDQSKQLTRVHIRDLQNFIQKTILKLSLSYVFEPNDSQTWSNWELAVKGLMETIKKARGLYEYKVTMSPTDEEIDQFRMPGKIVYKPIKDAEEITIYFNLKSKASTM